MKILRQLKTLIGRQAQPPLFRCNTEWLTPDGSNPTADPAGPNTPQPFLDLAINLVRGRVWHWNNWDTTPTNTTNQTHCHHEVTTCPNHLAREKQRTHVPWHLQSFTCLGYLERSLVVGNDQPTHVVLDLSKMAVSQNSKLWLLSIIMVSAS